jgi:hypothetical protein
LLRIERTVLPLKRNTGYRLVLDLATSAMFPDFRPKTGYGRDV